MAALRAGTAQLAEEDGTLRPIHGGDWVHLWYDGEYDSSNMMKGFLKNHLLVKVRLSGCSISGSNICNSRLTAQYSLHHLQRTAIRDHQALLRAQVTPRSTA